MTGDRFPAPILAGFALLAAAGLAACGAGGGVSSAGTSAPAAPPVAVGAAEAPSAPFEPAGIALPALTLAGPPVQALPPPPEPATASSAGLDLRPLLVAPAAEAAAHPFRPSPPRPLKASKQCAATPRYDRRGTASFYGRDFHGETTASGEPFDMNALTAAHRTLPFGTRVKVTNLKNGRSVVLTINDRGPFTDGRLIDVSRRAARELGFLDEEHLAPVRVQAVGGGC